MKKKKILYIHHGWGIGGAPISLLNLIISLDRDLFDVKVLFLKRSDVVSLFQNYSIPYEVLDSFFYRKFYRYFQHTDTKTLKIYELHKWLWVLLSWILSSFVFSPKILKKEAPDIIHLNSLVLTDWCIASKRINSRLVLHVRESLSSGSFGVRENIFRYIINHTVDRVICISYDNAKSLSLENKTTVIYNPIVPPEKGILKVSKKETINRVLYLGGAHEIKGIKLIEGLALLLPTSIELICAGYYPDGFFIKGNNTRIIGHLDNTKLYSELALADLLLVPNIKPHFARPIIEAYMVRTPVLASKIRGMDEIVFDKVTGYLVEPDIRAFADKINEIYIDSSKLEKMGDEGFNFANSNFNSMISVSKVLKIYLELLDEKIN